MLITPSLKKKFDSTKISRELPLEERRTGAMRD